MTETERVLFVHAHPDDESISTGGTIATLVDRGAAVTVLTCTRGERGEVIPPELKGLEGDLDALASYRSGELHEALRILGVTDHRFLGAANARWQGRQPRRYFDSGMGWGPSGVVAGSEIDPESLVSAEFGDVAADIASVILATRPTVVVSYDEAGGYGHPDHIRAHQAARRAAEVYGVPFFAIKPRTSREQTMDVDVSAVFDRKRAALAAHRTQLVVEGERFTLSNGESQPIDRVERFRRLRRDSGDIVPFARRSLAHRLVTALSAGVVGLVAGAILTIFHQASLTIGATPIPFGIVVAITTVALLLVGLRVYFDGRLVAGFAALGVMVSVAAMTLPSPGGSLLIVDTPVGIGWAIAATAVAVVVLAWPRPRRRAAGKLEVQ